MGTLLLVTANDPLAILIQTAVAVDLGFVTRRVTSCADAVLLLPQLVRPALVVVDLAWPYAADLEFCDQLLREPQPLPVVVLGATPTDPDFLSRPSLVAVAKPLDLDTLVSVLRFLVLPLGAPWSSPPHWPQPSDHSE